jgi:hypothetical protein
LARWQIQNDIEGLGEPGDQELASREVVDIETGIDGDNELERDTIAIKSTYISRSEMESIQSDRLKHDNFSNLKKVGIFFNKKLRFSI